MAQMASEREIKMYNEIIDKGCCKRCALRYLGYDKSLISFEHPNTSLVNFGFLSPMEEFEIGPPDKKKKANPCSVCVDLFQDSTLEEMLAHKNLPKTSEYEHKSFNVYITFPVCINVRDHSMKIHLKRTFPDVFDAGKVMQIKSTFRDSIERRLSKVVKKSFRGHEAKFNIHFHVDYELDQEELQLLAGNNSTLSRHQANSLLSKISDEEFSKLVTVPPKVPFYGVIFKDVTFFSESINLVGSFWKYSRGLCQTAKESDESIEVFINQAIREIAGDCKKTTFSASGFDERHVRLLDGRTFQVQIEDPKFASVPRSVCKKIETLLRRHKNMKVAKLRQEDKCDIAVLFNHQHYSPRLYRVLCIVKNCKNVNHAVNAINMYSEIQVEQKTPIRVVHQRPLYKRKFKIYHVEAQALRENLIQVDLCADVGLQIPEFVNGDMGRTNPSIAAITNANVDVLAIDILKFQATLACAATEEEIII